MTTTKTPKLTSKSIVKIVNNTTGLLNFRDFEGRKHNFPRFESYKMMSMAQIEGLYGDSPSLIEGGYVIFPDVRVYQHLGMEEQDYSKLISKEQIEKLLEKSADEIVDALKDAPSNIKDNVATVAKRKKVDSKKKVKAIKEATGKSIDVEDEE